MEGGNATQWDCLRQRYDFKMSSRQAAGSEGDGGVGPGRENFQIFKRISGTDVSCSL